MNSVCLDYEKVDFLANLLIPTLARHTARPAAVPLGTAAGRAAYYFTVYLERVSKAPSPAGKDESPWPPRFPDG